MMHNDSSLIAISKTSNPTTFEKTIGVNDFYFGDGSWDYPLGACECSEPATPTRSCTPRR